MARKQRSPPPTVLQPLRDDGAASESDHSSPREMPSVKRRVAPDPTHKSGSKSDPKAAKKRGASDESDKGVTKKARVSNGDEKSSGVKRVWSEEDAIAIMQGLIDYRAEHHEDPDYEALLEFVKDSLQAKVTVTQLKDKVKRLRRKYKAQKGNDVVFVKPSEEKLFQLSKQVWDGGNADEGNVGPKEKDKGIEKAAAVDDGANENGIEVENDEEVKEGMGFKEMYPYLSQAWESDVSFPQPLRDLNMRKFEMNACEKLRGLENEWKDVFLEDLELYAKKLDLKTKIAKVVLDKMISSDP